MVGENVALGSSTDRAESDDGAVAGIEITTDHGLYGGDHLCRYDDRVDTAGGVGAVPRAAMYYESDVVRRGVPLAIVQTEDSDLAARVDVQAENRIYRWVLQDSLLDQESGSTYRLFGWLEDQFDGSRQLGAALREDSRRAEQNGRVDIVTAGVHAAGDLRAIGDVFGVLEGERIEVGAQGDDASLGGAVNQTQDTGSGESSDVRYANLVQDFLNPV